MNTTVNTIDLLKRIIEKGGLMGSCAKLYLDNVTAAEIFIKECKAQCHNRFAVEYWGEELVRDIFLYCQEKRSDYRD